MSTYEGTVFDAHDELGFGFADVDYVLNVTIIPGHPATREEPETQATVELDAVEVVAVRPQDGSGLHRPLTAADLDTIRAFIDRQTEREWDEISARVLEGDTGEFDPMFDDDEFDRAADDADAFRSIGWGCDEDYRSCLGDEE